MRVEVSVSGVAARIQHVHAAAAETPPRAAARAHTPHTLLVVHERPHGPAADD